MVKTECCSVVFSVNIVPVLLQPLPMWDGLAPLPSKAISLLGGAVITVGPACVALCPVFAVRETAISPVSVVLYRSAAIGLCGGGLTVRHSHNVVAVEILPLFFRLQSAVHKRVFRPVPAIHSRRRYCQYPPWLTGSFLKRYRRCWLSASSSAVGRSFPRRSALVRMPRQAVPERLNLGLTFGSSISESFVGFGTRGFSPQLRVKKNFRGCKSVEICDESNPSASLRNPEILSIMHPIGNGPVSHFAVETSVFVPCPPRRQRHIRGARFDDSDDFREDGLEVFACVFFSWA